MLLRPPGGATEPRSLRRLPVAGSEACVRGGAWLRRKRGPRDPELRELGRRCMLYPPACQPASRPASPPAHGGAGAAELGRGPAQDPGSLPRGPEPGLRLRLRGVPPGGTQCTPGGESPDLRLCDQPQARHLLTFAGSRVPPVPAEPQTRQAPTSKMFILPK